MRKFLGTCFVSACVITLFVCILFGYAKASGMYNTEHKKICGGVKKAAFGIMEARQNGVPRDTMNSVVFGVDMHPSSVKILDYMIEQAFYQTLQFDAASRYNSMTMFANRMYKSCMVEKPDVFKLEEIYNNEKR